MNEPQESPRLHAIVHTPGPWHTFRLSDYWIIGEAPPKAGIHVARAVTLPNAEANARLLAAAPDLLELAEMFISEWEATWVDPDEVSHEWMHLYDRAKELIRAAKGGHSVV